MCNVFGLTIPWREFPESNGIIGVMCMIGAVRLTLYSLALYVQRYSGIFLGRAGAGAAR